MPAENFVAENRPIPAVAIIAGIAVLFGASACSYGFWIAWHPLGFIVGGLSASALGILLGRRAQHQVRRRP